LQTEAEAMKQQLGARESEMCALVSVLESMTLKAAEYEQRLLRHEQVSHIYL
jgi:hypothetical protein